MDFKIGKIYSFNKTTGVGQIVTDEKIYMFTIDDLLVPIEELNDGDIVKFKGEKVYDKVDKAFFIKKLKIDSNKINH